MTATAPDRIDLAPAAAELSRLARAVQSSVLDDPTPCDGMSVRDLLDHLLGAAEAFRRAPGGEPVAYQAGGVDLDAEGRWRQVLDDRLAGLVAAWGPVQAWEGETHVAGMTMPAAETGAAAVEELVLHGWDLARATRQAFSVDDASLAAVLAFVTDVAEAGPEAREGLFGPPVEVPPDATALERALCLAGREPAWSPPSSRPVPDGGEPR